jgi:hypothetical protein
MGYMKKYVKGKMIPFEELAISKLTTMEEII